MFLYTFIRDRNVQILLAQWTLVILLVWFGAMKFMAGASGALAAGFNANALLQGTGLADHAADLSKGLGGLSILSAILLIARDRLPTAGYIGAILAFLVFFIPLTQLFTNPVWIDGLGGFPAIGAGQGIIKYVAISGLALYLVADSKTQAGNYSEKLEQWSLKIMLLGIALVLIWIGGMKFTAVEANGIKPLLEGHIAFSWMLDSFSLQMASNIIGVIEIVTALLLLLWWINSRLFLLGAVLAIGTFLLTLSFMITLPGWEDSLGGFPVLSRSGIFLLKDLGLLTATLLLIGNPHIRGD